MAGNKKQAQQIVANIVVESGIEIGYGQLFRGKFATQFFVLALEPSGPAEVINGSMFGGRHQPCAWVVRDARLGPLLEGGDQRILCEILGDADVAHDARET